MKRASLLMVGLLAACAAEEKRPDIAGRTAPGVMPPPTVSAEPPPPPIAPPGPPPAPRAPKGKFVSFAFAPSSGKVDEIGNRDGAFAPDGVKDLVFDAEIEGPAVAFIIVSTDGKLSADTFVGTQIPPSEEGAEIKPGLMTAGIGVFENDKLANAKDGSLTPLADGPHRLALHVSVPNPPKGPYKAMAVYDDRSVATSAAVSR